MPLFRVRVSTEGRPARSVVVRCQEEHAAAEIAFRIIDTDDSGTSRYAEVEPLPRDESVVDVIDESIVTILHDIAERERDRRG